MWKVLRKKPLQEDRVTKLQRKRRKQLSKLRANINLQLKYEEETTSTIAETCKK